MAALLTASELSERLARLSSWQHSGTTITRQFSFPDFLAALRFVNAVAGVAEAANHHPDIDIRWNTVRLVLSTHSAGGLTALDFDLAEKIDRLEFPTPPAE